MRIQSLVPNATNLLNNNKAQSVEKAPEFKDILKSIISETQDLRVKDQSNNAILATGQMDSLDSIMIDMEKADIALQFTLQIRNKILDAYQEIMRMQI